jgi:hypothetical protein
MTLTPFVVTRVILVLAGCLFVPHQTQAATLTPSALRDGSIVVSLTGQIESRDGPEFRRLVQAANQTGVRVSYLVLDSLGGDVRGGTDIAITVRDNSISTIVPANALCASACFMPFLIINEPQTI